MRFPAATIKEEPADTAFIIPDFKYTFEFEAELLDVLGNEGWEAYAIRSVPSHSGDQEPEDEFYFKRLINTSSSQILEVVHQQSGAAVEDPPIIVVKSGPKPPPLFDVVLVRVPADRKIAIINALRQVKPSLGLAEAKELVEILPSKVYEGISESVARAAKEKLEQADAGVRLETMTCI